MQLPSSLCKRFVPVALGAAAAMAWQVITPAQANVLYTLETKCSLNRGPAQPCTVEAKEEIGSTTYRHTIGDQEVLIKVTEDPGRMSIWNPDSATWNFLRSAGALFDNNTVCYNERDLCVVNANYLNSIAEERPDIYDGRNLARIKFDDEGRINLSCFDDGCAEVN